MINFKIFLTNTIYRKRLTKAIVEKLHTYLVGFWLCISFRKDKVKISIPKKNLFDEKDLDLSKKIFEFYKRMKIDQLQVNSAYNPSSMWQDHIDIDYKYLKDAYETNNLKNFSYFLQNFGNWENYLGIENQTFIKNYSKNIFSKKFLTNRIVYDQKKLWEYFNQNNQELSELDMPRYGNQCGILIDHNIFNPGLGGFFTNVYSEIINKYLKKDKKNTILEIGGGYGKLAYFILKKQKNCCYIGLDIPEVLILGAYYLSKCFPEKKIFLYGQEKFNNNILQDYDLIFLPGWEIENISEDTVDMSMNKNSLGEMNPETAKKYLKHVNRISKYFFSMNHEFFRNKFSENNYSLINKEFNLDNNFKELIRYPDISHMTYKNNKIDLDSEIFFYMYEKN